MHYNNLFAFACQVIVESVKKSHSYVYKPKKSHIKKKDKIDGKKLKIARKPIIDIYF